MSQIEKPTVWIVENNKSTAQNYQQALTHIFNFREFESMREFKEYYLKTLQNRLSDMPDFIISELYLDDGNLIELFQDPKFPKNNRSRFYVVSHENDPIIIENCLKLGAYDFLAKPVVLPVLKAKLHFAAKTKKGLHEKNMPILKANTLTFYKNNSSITTLTPKEIRLFSILHEANGSSLTREQIIAEIWKDKKTCNKSFDVHLFNLRRKLWSLEIEIQFIPPNSYRLEKDCVQII